MADRHGPRAGAFRALLRKEVLHGWRDRSVLLLVFVVPLLLAGITSLAFGRLADGGKATIGVVDHDGGTAATLLVHRILPGLKLDGTGLVDTKLYMSDAEAEKDTRGGRLAAAIVIPSRFGSGIRAGKPPALRLLTGGDTSIGAPVAESVLRGFSAQTGAIGLALRTATSGPGAHPLDRKLAQGASGLTSPVTIGVERAGPHTLTPAAYFAPSMLVLALFFCGQIAARGLVAERARGTLARIVASAVPVWWLPAARYLVALAVGMLSGGVLLGVFAAFGVSFGDPLVLAVLVLVAAAAMIGVSSLVVLLARTEQQAGSLGTTVAFLLAVVGGTFVPPSRTPPVLEHLALVTPNGWAARAFADLSLAPARPWAAVGPALLVLAGIALASALVTAGLARRTVRHTGA